MSKQKYKVRTKTKVWANGRTEIVDSYRIDKVDRIIVPEDLQGIYAPGEKCFIVTMRLYFREQDSNKINIAPIMKAIREVPGLAFYHREVDFFAKDSEGRPYLPVYIAAKHMEGVVAEKITDELIEESIKVVKKLGDKKLLTDRGRRPGGTVVSLKDNILKGVHKILLTAGERAEFENKLPEERYYYDGYDAFLNFDWENTEELRRLTEEVQRSQELQILGSIRGLFEDSESEEEKPNNIASEDPLLSDRTSNRSGDPGSPPTSDRDTVLGKNLLRTRGGAFLEKYAPDGPQTARGRIETVRNRSSTCVIHPGGNR